MTNELLSYQTSGAMALSRFRGPAWIMLLVMGILYCLGGLFMGGGGILLILIFARMGEKIPVTPILATISVGIVALGVGVTYLWTSVLVKRGSRTAARVARVFVVINAILLLLWMLLTIVALLAPQATATKSGRWSSVIITFLVVTLIISANAVLGWLLTRLLRETRVVAT